jgi:hypothetical protein
VPYNDHGYHETHAELLLDIGRLFSNDDDDDDDDGNYDGK